MRPVHDLMVSFKALLSGICVGSFKKVYIMGNKTDISVLWFYTPFDLYSLEVTYTFMVTYLLYRCLWMCFRMCKTELFPFIKTKIGSITIFSRLMSSTWFGLCDFNICWSKQLFNCLNFTEKRKIGCFHCDNLPHIMWQYSRCFVFS